MLFSYLSIKLEVIVKSQWCEHDNKRFHPRDLDHSLLYKLDSPPIDSNSLRDQYLCLSQETKNSKCSNCDQLKGNFREQQNSYELKIRDLEACIRDLTVEKEALQQKVAKERRSSEEFTSRVQQMVQQLETGQRGNEPERDENSRGQLLEKENFFNMVKRFFTEHEGLRDHAQECLGDLRQLQEYFQGCSNGTKDVISHAHAFETVAKRMSLLKSLLESVVNELGRPLKEEESDTEGNEDCPLEASIRAEMSWDDYEREVAYKAFKGDVEDILQQIETDKKRFDRKADEFHEVKRAHMALRKVRKRSRQAIERTLGKNEEDFHEEEPQKGPQQTNTRMDSRDGEDLVEVVKQLLDQNREELDLKMSGYFNSLENTIKQHAQPVVLSDERRQKSGSENVKDAIDGKYAIGELDLVKRKLSDVQKSIKHLIGSLAEIEHEKNSVESKMNLLNGELSRKESQYEAISEDLKRATRTASEHEISFRNRLDALSSEKDQINSELRRMVGILKEKELELVTKSQQLKHLQTAFKDEERAMKNKLDSLEQENNSLWLDYKEADKRAEIKEKEFKELSERLKKSQGYIHSVFSSLTNMDDELQKARDIEVFSEQEFN